MTKVTLEVGHGPFRTRNGQQGFEEGATGPGTTEYKEVTVMAKIASEVLCQRGYDVKISDPAETLRAIGQQAAGSDIFVSLHLNAFNKQAQGTEVLIHRNGTNEDKELAQTINTCLVSALKLANRGVRRQGLAVLSGVPASVQAACLTEAFFIDSVADAATVRTMVEKAGNAIAEGIDQYAKVKGLKPKMSVVA